MTDTTWCFIFIFMALSLLLRLEQVFYKSFLNRTFKKDMVLHLILPNVMTKCSYLKLVSIENCDVPIGLRTMEKLESIYFCILYNIHFLIILKINNLGVMVMLIWMIVFTLPQSHFSRFSSFFPELGEERKCACGPWEMVNLFKYWRFVKDTLQQI